MTSDTERQQYELRTLHSYLLTILPSTPLPPDNLLLSPNSLAIQSAIAGIENQLTKLERDEKLRRKFMNEKGSGNPSSSSSASGGNSAAGNKSMKTMMKKENDDEEDMDDEYVKMTKEDADAAAATKSTTTTAAAAKSTNDDDDDTKMDDDWEETDRRIDDLTDGKSVVQEDSETEQTNTDDDEYFRYLASTTIAKIAAAKLHVVTPLGALALVLHIALLIKGGERSGSGSGAAAGGSYGDNELRCTGVPPPEDGKGSGGFAPPVRELPPGVLVPDSWEESAVLKKTVDGKEAAQTIAFRYWRGGGGGMLGGVAPTTVYLTLQLLPSTSTEGMEEVHVTFGLRQEGQSAKQPQQPPRPHLTVRLGMHVNLDGFKTAKKSASTGTISPTLFYISLSELLSRFDATFSGVLSPIAVKTIETNAQLKLLENAQPVPPPTAPMVDMFDGVRATVPPTMPFDPPLDSTHGDDATKTRKRGDFEGDLLPGGPLQPPFGIEDNRAIPPGSQVGPDHPIFDRTFGEDDYYDYNEDYQYGPGMGGRDGFGLPGLPSGMGMRPR
ncbi:hypothetical protein ACHAWU_007682 [Discostella pseudostelligera]|uniref:Proteasome inhibitor PI31 subunit n=1 Tax=Discostella pseudostelligera TaxID=259834 RepID=A0ABD3M2V4_9STRA